MATREFFAIAGHPFEQLAESSSFLEVAWLLRYGELPNQGEYDQFVHDITYHTYVHENMRKSSLKDSAMMRIRRIERCERGDRAVEHRHRMRIIAEPFEELPHVSCT